MLDPVMLHLADRLIEAPLPAGRSDHVPKADTPLGEPLKPRFVGQRLKLLADRASQQPPELIGRMSIVTLGCKRRVAWKAAEDE